MTRQAIIHALDRFKVRHVKVKGLTRYAVFAGSEQATNAGSYDRAIQDQRRLTVDAIMEAVQ